MNSSKIVKAFLLSLILCIGLMLIPNSASAMSLSSINQVKLTADDLVDYGDWKECNNKKINSLKNELFADKATSNIQVICFVKSNPIIAMIGYSHVMTGAFDVYEHKKGLKAFIDKLVPTRFGYVGEAYDVISNLEYFILEYLPGSSDNTFQYHSADPGVTKTAYKIGDIFRLKIDKIYNDAAVDDFFN